MTATTIEQKARRLLEDGAVTIVEIRARRRVCTVAGDSGTVHRVIWLANLNGWRCSCPATVDECSHARAAHLACLARLAESATWWDGDQFRVRRSP